MLLLHAKNNMAAKPQGLAYRLVQTLVGPEQNIVASYVAWDSVPVSISANDALRATEEGHDRSAKAEAMEFLRAALSEGAVPAGEISRMARDHGLTTKVVRSAREALGVKIDRDGFGPGSKSVWSLTAAPIDAQTIHRCPTQGMGKYGVGGQVCGPSEIQGRQYDGGRATPKSANQPNVAPFSAPPSSSVSDPARDDYPEMPEFLRRPPPDQPQANGRAPALGPPGDSLDDFR
jgi:plasmid stability protein